MKEHGDEDGMFWSDPIKVKTGASLPRRRPSIPDTGWRPPAYFPDLSSAKRIAIDVETHDPNLESMGPGIYRGDCELVGVSIGTDDGFRGYYPIAHADSANFPKEHVLSWLKVELARQHQDKVGANLYYDLDVLGAEGVKIAGIKRDVQIAEPLIDENLYEYNLESLSQRYLGVGKEEEAMTRWAQAAFGCSKKGVKKFMKEIPAVLAGPYAEGDVDRPLRILEMQEKILDAQGLMPLFDLESRLVDPLLRMRQTGVPIDPSRAEQVREMLDSRYKAAVATMGGAYQNDKTYMQKVFDREGVDYPRTGKGNASFRKQWLEHTDHWLCKAVTEARKYEKMRGTFLEGYLGKYNTGGRIHCQFNQLRGDAYGTVSGRFSSSHPNLQNIPSRDPELGPLIRSLFVPEAGKRWWKKDWSQIEYRLIVHFAAAMALEGAREAMMLYQSDKTTDFHQVVADIVGLKRNEAKHINFGIAYGQGALLLALNLGVDIDTARELLGRVRANAPFITKLNEWCMNEVTREGEILTLMKRRRRFNLWEQRDARTSTNYNDVESIKLPLDEAEAKWGKMKIKRAGTHKGLNAMIQGSAADIMKKAMVDIWDAGLFDILPIHLTVHDELDGSVGDSKIEMEALAELHHIMENCVSLSIPLLAEGGIGPNWGALK